MNNRRTVISQAAGGNAAAETAVWQAEHTRNEKMRGNPSALADLHAAEANAATHAATPYNALPDDAARAARRTAITHSEAHSQLVQHLQTSAPAPARPLFAVLRSKPQARVDADGVGHHYDGTVTHVENGQVHMLQRGSDHANVVSTAQSNLANQNSAYHSKSELRAARRQPAQVTAGELVSHDGTRATLNGDNKYVIQHEGFDHAHVKSQMGTNWEGYTAPPPPAPKVPKAERKAAQRIARIEQLVDNAGVTTASVSQTHLDTARDHVKKAARWMHEGVGTEAHHGVAVSRLREKHINAVVNDYAQMLSEGKTLTHESPHLTNALVTQTKALEPSLARRMMPSFARAADSAPAAAGRLASVVRATPGAVGDALLNVGTADIAHNAVTRAAGRGLSATGHGLSTGAGAIRNGVVAAAPVVGGVITTVGGAIGNATVATAKGGLHYAKGAGKIALIAGAAGAGLIAVTQLLKSPRPPRRMDNFMSGDMGSEPIVFNGGANVGMGALSVPQVGQQAQMGSWVAQLPAMDQGQSIPTGAVPTR